MRHNREEVIERTVREYERLDRLVSGLSTDDWARLLARKETADPWTVKDALAHITWWKGDRARKARGERPPPDIRGMRYMEKNHLVYERWRDRSPEHVIAWHRRVQAEVIDALKAVPETWFNSRERSASWPYALDGHSAEHRVRDIERALKQASRES